MVGECCGDISFFTHINLDPGFKRPFETSIRRSMQSTEKDDTREPLAQDQPARHGTQ